MCTAGMVRCPDPIVEDEEDGGVNSPEFDDDRVEIVQPESRVDVPSRYPAPGSSTGEEILEVNGSHNDFEGVDKRPEANDDEHEREM